MAVKIVKPVSKKLAKAKTGRKPVCMSLTDEQLAEAESALSVGFPQTRVAQLLGISDSAFSRMLNRNKGKNELATTLSLAKEKGKKRLLGLIDKHAQRNWQAAAWLLERCNGSEFAQRTQTGNASSVTVNLQNVLAAQSKRPAESGSKSVDV
jgi:predicted transcriptional regulator